MSHVVSWMNSPIGRSARMLAGAALIVGGVIAGGAAGVILAVVGLVPLIAGATGRCLLAPAFHLPMQLHG